MKIPSTTVSEGKAAVETEKLNKFDVIERHFRIGTHQKHQKFVMQGNIKLTQDYLRPAGFLTQI